LDYITQQEFFSREISIVSPKNEDFVIID